MELLVDQFELVAAGLDKHHQRQQHLAGLHRLDLDRRRLDLLGLHLEIAAAEVAFAGVVHLGQTLEDV